MGNGFSRDSPETKFVESIPIVGYFAAAVHGIAGNDEHAKRAAAKCTSITLTTVGGIAGGVVGGPLGAMAGGAIGGGAGLGSQHGVSQHIKDKQVRSEVSDASAERVVASIAFGAISGGAGTAVKTMAASGMGAMSARAVGVAGSSTFATVPKVLVDGDMQESHLSRIPEEHKRASPLHIS